MSGPACRKCRTSEARCAFVGGSCCPDCTHWLAFDASGEPRIAAPGRELLPVEHGTDRGYFQHRVRLEPACPDCRAAHSRHVLNRRREATA